MEYLNSLNYFELFVLVYLIQFVVTVLFSIALGFKKPNSLKEVLKLSFMPYMVYKLIKTKF